MRRHMRLLYRVGKDAVKGDPVAEKVQKTVKINGEIRARTSQVESIAMAKV